MAFEPSETGARLYLTKRATGLQHHPGQIAFPGGKVDGKDAGPQEAALREAEEEIGLPPSAVEVLGALPTHETVTGFLVTPVFGLVRQRFFPREQSGEVEEVFSIPLSHVANLGNYRVESRFHLGIRRYYFALPWGPYYIWGATARMLRGLSERIT